MVGATWGVASMGLAIVAVTVVALGVAVVGSRVPRRLFEAAGTTLQCGLPPGVGAAGVVLTLRLEIGAAVTLVLLVAAYEVGDYLVGSGASSSIEGPIAGIVAMAAICAAIAVLRVPPFDGGAVFVFGGFAALFCPLGQVAASALLPERRRARPRRCAGSIPSCCSGRRGRSWWACCSRSCRERPGAREGARRCSRRLSK